MRDLTRQKPGSLFDNTILSILKSAHDKYGLKVQLNLFYKTHSASDGEFSLEEMTDAYKQEWKDNADWLKLSFHARQTDIIYPYINASYDEVKKDFKMVKNEIVRFAGEKSFAQGLVLHWIPMSKEGCCALYDCGTRIMSASSGDDKEYIGAPDSLPALHAARLLQSKKPEEALLNIGLNGAPISGSFCGYNHISDRQAEETKYNTKSVLDAETGMRFKKFCNTSCVEKYKIEEIESALESLSNSEYICGGTHEPFFYPEYRSYQPDLGEKIHIMCKVLAQSNYNFVFVHEFAE